MIWPNSLCRKLNAALLLQTLTLQGHQARKSLWNCRQSVAAEEHIIHAIRAKLCSCATGQVERCALANTLSCSVSGSPLSLGLIVSVHLRRGCHASVCSAAPTTMSNWKRGREKHLFSFHCVTALCQVHITLCFSSCLLLCLFVRFVVVGGVCAWQEHAAKLKEKKNIYHRFNTIKPRPQV